MESDISICYKIYTSKSNLFIYFLNYLLKSQPQTF